MCLFKYGLSIEHDSIDPCHLLQEHQHEADHQRLVDARILQVGKLKTGTLRKKTTTERQYRKWRISVWDCR